MPPKKQEQKAVEYKPCFVLPIFLSGPKSRSASALAHPVTIKKNIDTAKVIEILKDKGLQQYIVNGQINQKGRKFVCENLKTVTDEFVASLSKPADPKKDAKKDAKKQAKKQEPVAQNVIPPIQITNQKNCNDFFVFLAGPVNQEELELALAKETRIDIVVIIKEKVMPGSRKPNYDLLNNQKTYEDIASSLKSTKVDPGLHKKDQANVDYNQIGRQLIEVFTAFKSRPTNQNPYKNTIILEIAYLDNLSNPQNNQNLFIQNFFNRVCKCTLELEQYNQWKTTRKLVPMIEPIKEIITKQVQVEDKNDKGKKGGKGGQPVFETVQQVIEKKFEDFPENVRSDLKDYFIVKKIKKNQKERKTTLPKDNESVYKQVLTDCLLSLPKLSSQKSNAKPAEKNSYKEYISELSDRIKNDFELKPLNKMTCESIVNKLRTINYWKNISMNNSISFEFSPIPTPFSFMELAQKSHNSAQQLEVEYIIRKIENMATKANPKIQWNFQDRKFVQRMTKQQLKSIINQELLHDPQIYTGRLVTENLNLLVLSRTNPPGRVLYHNSIFEWKVLPDFQKWSDCFLGQEELKKEQFLDYPFQEAGNLSIKVKNMMPVDNTVIKHEVHTIGDRKTSIVQFQKNKHTFGLSKKKLPDQNGYVYWHDIEDQYRLRIFKNKQVISTTPANQQEEQNKKQIKIDGVVVELENKGKYIVAMDPTPTIYWRFPGEQKIRKIGNLGQITSYRTDGSIVIYHPNGDTSTFRNGKWSRISSSSSEVKIQTLNQGEDCIKIREDQTIFVTNTKGNQKTIFPDGTQMLEKVKQKVREIKNPNGPFIRIYLPRDYNLNVIGHGSAFAYLGFKDILERSYDGYLFEFIDHEISSHFYTERFDRNGVLQTEQVRLIAYKDSSIIKIDSRGGKIVFNSPSQKSILTESVFNERWLQTFTTEANHGEGVFDIDLGAGHIENKDSQTNRFVAKVDERSIAQIAVSFITEDEDDSVANFPSGFHIKQQNYFLPPPANRIPPRIFSIKQDGSGCEYLSQEQIHNMQQYSVTKQYLGNKTVIQYCCEEKPQTNYMNITFSMPVNLEAFGLPDVLKTVSTKENLIPVQFNNLRHRVIEEVNWDSNYTNVKNLQNILEEETNKKSTLKESRRKQEKPKQSN